MIIKAGVSQKTNTMSYFAGNNLDKSSLFFYSQKYLSFFYLQINDMALLRLTKKIQ